MTAKRDLPLHPQFGALGLCQHAARQIARHGPNANLFPDLRLRKGSGFGDQLDYRFRKLVQTQLNGNPDGKVFHSFRHYVAPQLGRMPYLRESVQRDILGHSGGSITAERYSKTTPLEAIRHLLCKACRSKVFPARPRRGSSCPRKDPPRRLRRWFYVSSTFNRVR